MSTNARRKTPISPKELPELQSTTKPRFAVFTADGKWRELTAAELRAMARKSCPCRQVMGQPMRRLHANTPELH